MAQGLDADFVTGGVNLGPVRRLLPAAKALHDVLLAYEMNGQPLPPDHGFPVRLVVPSWVGISSVKWVGQIEVSATPLFSPWNTQFYRLFGPDYPGVGAPRGPGSAGSSRGGPPGLARARCVPGLPMSPVPPSRIRRRTTHWGTCSARSSRIRSR